MRFLLCFLMVVFLIWSSYAQKATNNKNKRKTDTLNTVPQGKDVLKTSTSSNQTLNMNKEKFWKVIELAKQQARGNKQKQEEAIVNELTKLSSEDIIEFEIILRQLIIEADDYKVIAAEKIIEGSVTDDPYLYFRCWLIGQGELTFNETLKNPDYLASVVEKGADTDFESLLYVTTKAFKIKTGKQKEDESFPRGIAYKKGLDYDFGAPPTKGKDWTVEELPELYPKLWNKFH